MLALHWLTASYYAKAKLIYTCILALASQQKPIAACHCIDTALAPCYLSSNPACPEAARTQQSSIKQLPLDNHDKGPDLVDTGNSTGSDQEIFEVVVDAWLNLRTGIVSALNYSQTAAQAVYTFNPNYDGQVAQELSGRADATDVFTVSLNCLSLSLNCLSEYFIVSLNCLSLSLYCLSTVSLPCSELQLWP